MQQQAVSRVSQAASHVLQKSLQLPSRMHAAAVMRGELRNDPAQARVLPVLDSLIEHLPAYDEAMSHHGEVLSAIENARHIAVARERLRQQSSGLLHRLSRVAHGVSPNAEAGALPNGYYGLPAPPRAPVPPRGVYLHGDVGCGKSMLMDLTFSAADSLVKSSARVHYHAFMASVYQMIHVYDRLSDEKRAELSVFHPLDAVVGRLGRANESASGGGLLCFDEFQVADVADARLMHGIFDRLMRSGTVVCFTANRAPSEVNRSQLRDKDFLPFLDLLHERCELINVESDVDYRAKMSLEQQDSTPSCYFAPDDEAGIREAWRDATNSDWDDVAPRELPVSYGRRLRVERARPDGSAVQMSSVDLIEAAVGASDYRALAQFTRNIFLTDILPVFANDTRNYARRFITLIDVCYEEKVRVVMRMEARKLDDMFNQVDTSAFAAEVVEGLQFEGEVAKEGVGADNRQMYNSTLFSGEDEVFAFRRAISRLKEMQLSNFGSRSIFNIKKSKV